MDYPEISNSNLYSQVREVHEDSRQDFTLATAQTRRILSAASGALSPTRLNTSISTPLPIFPQLTSLVPPPPAPLLNAPSTRQSSGPGATHFSQPSHTCTPLSSRPNPGTASSLMPASSSFLRHTHGPTSRIRSWTAPAALEPPSIDTSSASTTADGREVGTA